MPIADIYAGALVFPAELGADAVRAYRDWAAAVPDEVTSIVRFLRPPPLPDVPEPIRDRPLLTIDAACIGYRGGGRARDRPAARARRADPGHLRPDPDRGAEPDPHGPRAAGPGDRPSQGDPRACRTRRSTRSSASRSGGRLAVATRRAAPLGRRARPRRLRTAARSRQIDAEFAMLGNRPADDPQLGEAIERPARSTQGDDGAVGGRRRLLQLRRAPLRRRRDPRPARPARGSPR